jgi:hypothetical protein
MKTAKAAGFGAAMIASILNKTNSSLCRSPGDNPLIATAPTHAHFAIFPARNYGWSSEVETGRILAPHPLPRRRQPLLHFHAG